MVPGQVLVACLDQRRRLIELLPVAADDESLPALAHTLAEAPRDVRAVVLATIRPNAAPAAKPHAAREAAVDGDREEVVVPDVLPELLGRLHDDQRLPELAGLDVGHAADLVAAAAR